MKKRFAVTALVAVPLALGAAVAVADSGPAPPAPVEVKKVSFTLTSAKCPALPQGVTVKGAGTTRRWVSTSTDASGVKHDTVIEVSSGAATDNRGGRYWFDYHNDYLASHTTVPYVALLTDHFDLITRGALGGGIHTFFTANLRVTSEDPFTATIEPTFVLGDPLDFKTGTERCDPL